VWSIYVLFLEDEMRLLFLQVERGNLFSLHDAAAATYYMLKIGRDNHQRRASHFSFPTAFKTPFRDEEKGKKGKGIACR